MKTHSPTQLGMVGLGRMGANMVRRLLTAGHRCTVFDVHCGPNGAGHFVKMVHNGIEYGIMAAYAEGLGVLKAACAGKQQGDADAETTPLRDPEHYQYES